MWNDPFESLYYEADYQAHSYTKNPIACLCVTEHPYINEEAAWKAYTNKGEKAVKVGLNIKELLKLLDEYAIKNGCNVYIGEVNYDYNKKDIEGLSKRKHPLHTFYFPHRMCVEHYLSLMLLKRKAFQYENEVRLFLVRNNENKFEDVVKITCDYLNSKILSEVIVEPLPLNTSKDIEENINTKRLYAKMS